jgi:hypothetical protein
MKKILRNTILLTAFGCSSLLGFAGIVIRKEIGEPGAQQKHKSTMWVQAGKIRMEMASERGKTIVIFDGDKQVLWMIQPDQGSYMEMTADTVARLSQQAGGADAQMEQAMKQMQQKMASMPPEQRAIIEQAMKGRAGAMGAGGAPPTITFQAKGGTERVGSFTCSRYDELSNGKRTAELCAATFDQFHLTEADLRSFQSMAKFMEPMRRMNPRGMSPVMPMEQIHGFPVRTVMYDAADKPTYEDTVLSVEQQSVEAGMFTLPAGLTKSDMMGSRGSAPPR